MNTYKDLQDAIHENAKNKGWWDKPRAFNTLALLCTSEVLEAFEEYRANRGLTEVYAGDNGKPEGIPVEMTDCAIRVLDMCGHFGRNVDAEVADLRSEEYIAGFCGPNFETLCSALVFTLSCTTAPGDTEPDDEQAAWDMLGVVFVAIEHWFEQNGLSLRDEIVRKHEYNVTRSYRHGNKAV